MESDILLKLQNYPDYKEGYPTAIPMCSVCKNLDGRNCSVYGKPPKKIQMDHQICDKVVLDKNTPSYSSYMELYGYRHKSEK